MDHAATGYTTGVFREIADLKRHDDICSLELTMTEGGAAVLARRQLNEQVVPSGCERDELIPVSKAVFIHALNLKTIEVPGRTKRRRRNSVIHMQALIEQEDPEERSRTEEVLYWRLLCGDKLIAYDEGVAKTEGVRGRVWQCKACGAAFATSAALRGHRSTAHAPRRTHACAACGAAFVRSDTLRAHARIHTGERPFLCDRCGATFAHAAELRQHARAHAASVGRPHRCAVCCASFVHRANLRKHERSHAHVHASFADVCVPLDANAPGGEVQMGVCSEAFPLASDRAQDHSCDSAAMKPQCSVATYASNDILDQEGCSHYVNNNHFVDIRPNNASVAEERSHTTMEIPFNLWCATDSNQSSGLVSQGRSNCCATGNAVVTGACSRSDNRVRYMTCWARGHEAAAPQGQLSKASAVGGHLVGQACTQAAAEAPGRVLICRTDVLPPRFDHYPGPEVSGSSGDDLVPQLTRQIGVLGPSRLLQRSAIPRSGATRIDAAAASATACAETHVRCQCELCGVCFSYLSHLDAHQRILHAEVPERPAVGATAAPALMGPCAAYAFRVVETANVSEVVDVHPLSRDDNWGTTRLHIPRIVRSHRMPVSSRGLLPRTTDHQK